MGLHGSLFNFAALICFVLATCKVDGPISVGWLGLVFLTAGMVF